MTVRVFPISKIKHWPLWVFLEEKTYFREFAKLSGRWPWVLKSGVQKGKGPRPEDLVNNVVEASLGSDIALFYLPVEDAKDCSGCLVDVGSALAGGTPVIVLTDGLLALPAEWTWHRHPLVWMQAGGLSAESAKHAVVNGLELMPNVPKRKDL